MIRRWVLGGLLLLAAASQASAASLRVMLVSEVSDEKAWRFEVVNDSVDILDVVRLNAVFYADGRRLWSETAMPTPALLRPGETGWVILNARMIPKHMPLRIDWELTWNPYSVPVLPRFWRTERAASVEVRPTSPSTETSQAPDSRSPEPAPRDPTWRF
ncbi:MAG TPA: hypothetical protein VLT62_19310 [Candidatus Methylomirabilis sp.]|nr:hypothetical protein [Candidatus Methylomirabilis sp.]